jgi:uncharacterized protein
MSEKEAKRVLITGGAGMTGRRLTKLLKDEGWEVVILSHSRQRTAQSTQSGETGKAGKATRSGQSGVWYWDVRTGHIDEGVLNGVSHIIHLAGAGIADMRWTKKRKQEIIDSRVLTARLLYDSVMNQSISLRCFISASATGIYGNVTLPHIFTEADEPAADFLAETCRLWEESADMFSSSGIRTVKIRTGIVLDREGGFMSRIAPLARLGLFAWFGNGRQYMPWIHIDDLCAIYLRALQDVKMEGPYNAVAPEHINQREFMSAYAGLKGKPALKAGIPSIIIRLALGEMASMLLNGSRVSPEALKATGFTHRYSAAAKALASLE